MDGSRARISAFVVSYNRPALLGTCLRALGFADEIVVVDKSSSEDVRAVARQFADRVLTVPWSPTVEETRAFALAQCRNEWVLFLDDDECLSPEAVNFLRSEMEAPRADIYALPLRHYVLGVHDERAYYWPEHHVRCFRRGTVAFSATVHAGIQLLSDRVMRVSPDAGVCIHHLSHADVASWIERTNRYTGRRDRARVGVSEPATAPEAHAAGRDGSRVTEGLAADRDAPGRAEDLVAFAHARIDHWVAHTRDDDPHGYPAVVALLRAIYDMIDRVKTWEESHGIDGAASFQELCDKLDQAHAGLERKHPELPASFPGIRRIGAAFRRGTFSARL